MNLMDVHWQQQMPITKGLTIIDAVKKYGADAVVVCMMKFCDPEEFDYPILLQQFEAAGREEPVYRGRPGIYSI